MTYDPTKPVSASNPPESRGNKVEAYDGELQTDGVTEKGSKKKNKPVGPAEPVVETTPAGRTVNTVDVGANPR